MGIESGTRVERLVFRPAADAPRPIDPAIVDQALAWLVKIQSGSASACDSDACDCWRQLHPDHERAWLRLCGLGRDLREGTSAVAPQIARSTLRGVDRQQRRWALKAVAGLGVGAWAAWSMRHDIASLRADHRTVAGERRLVVLADGTQVMLNTRTAIDVRIDASTRTLRLLGGEIMVTTARDAAQRPFVVLGRDGRIVPIGTRFVVREFDGDGLGGHAGESTEVTVLEGAVDVSAGERSQVTRVSAGSRVRYGAASVGTPARLDESAAAWADGSLVVERMRLADFLAELGRYRGGVLRCDPAVAGVLVSGSFPLADTDAVLAMLEETLPVRRTSLSRYWVTVSAR
ncbi:Fe2+-dicitrate sensor protein [Variovorax sp. KBW07]|uniref:FecR domain-containing protein n=1 Tax=Variovorax sp. KBW07 TaxID=2153358 RepID=UPI000F58B3B8|nr:FecR domain-containing protein [Variovorax sp. KBW07]RQO61585.1 Fe2+-dicitrate sensor protein [Variovorax sp. KBW07]